jgi:hypothetical protein
MGRNELAATAGLRRLEASSGSVQDWEGQGRMDNGYETYCLADPVFYDSPLLARGHSPNFEPARRPVPEGWERFEQGDWLVYRPQDVDLPTQGWKIHASACLDNAEEILAAVWGYCVPKRISFKFVPNRLLLFLRNAKYADRGASGKFITIYPLDEAQLELVANELGAILDGRSGPYILSDLRWGAGPLHVRYGGFANRFCVGPGGSREPAIEDATGRLVPDRRGPTFSVPEWVQLPECLASHLAARNGAKLAEIPYGFEEALHFSNGGGLYRGVDQRSEEPVVLKEARPHAGLSVDGADAVARLQREREMLERLGGLGVAPAVRDYFVLGEHHFLVLELVEGKTLSRNVGERNPLLRPTMSPGRSTSMPRWSGRSTRSTSAASSWGTSIHPTCSYGPTAGSS